MSADLFPLDERGRMLLSVVVGLVNFVTIAAVVRALSPRDLVTARARRHAKRRRELREARLAPNRVGLRRSLELARGLVQRLKLDAGADAKKAAGLLTQAGWRSPEAVAVYLTARLASPLVLGLLTYLGAEPVLHLGAGTMRLFASAGGALFGAYLPTLMLKNAVLRRQQALTRGLPDMLDLMVICAEAGLSLDGALVRVSREIGGGSPEWADELGLTAIELSFLPDRRQALTNLSQRVGLPGVSGLVSTLLQAERYGTPLGQALRVLAVEFRDARMLKAEEKAARLPATLSMPLITFILPPLFVVLIGPAIIQAMAANWN